MTRSRRLEPLVRIADERQGAAARRLAESRRTESGLEARLGELRAYREEYRRHGRDAEGVSGERLKELRVFLDRLDMAVREVTDRLAVARRRCEERRREWLATRSHCRALAELVDRARSAERTLVARREQAETDEHAQRGAGRPRR